MKNLGKIAKQLNMRMNKVAVWCGLDACFDLSKCEDRQMEEVCKDYTSGIVKYFKTKNRKRDDANYAEKEDQ